MINKALHIAKSEDLFDIVSLHKRAFPVSFLTELGDRVLSAYYSIVITYSEANLFILSSDERLIGFVALANEPTKFYAKLYTSPSFILSVIQSYGLIKTLKLFINRNSEKPACLGAEVMSIVSIEPGGGSILLQAAENYLLGKNKDSIAIYTDSEENDAVLTFYKKYSYVVVAHYIVNKRKMLYLSKCLR